MGDWISNSLPRLIEVILAGGLGVILRDVINFFLRRSSDSAPAVQRMTEQGIVEKALLNMASSNDELTEEMARLRSLNAELESRGWAREEWWQTRWDSREQRWSARESEMQSEIDAMRSKMLELIRELDEMRARLQDRLVREDETPTVRTGPPRPRPGLRD